MQSTCRLKFVNQNRDENRDNLCRKEPMMNQSKFTSMALSLEKKNGQVTVGLTVVSDWLQRWRECF